MAETASGGAGSMDYAEDSYLLNGTPRKRDRAAVPVLPEDLVQWEILVRLPAKELLRCRAVCRSWRRLTCDSAFLLAHHRRQPSLPLVLFSATDHPLTNDATVDALDVRQTPAVRRPILGFDDYNNIYRRKFTVHASCDGLLLLYLSNHRFYLCNPATRQWCAVPGLSGCNVAALYRHRPSGEYRVLYWKKGAKSKTIVYYVLTVGSPVACRCIGLPLASSPSMKKSDTARWTVHGPPVLLRDCLHWFSCDRKIVVFDTVAESFRWMQPPSTTRGLPHLFQTDDDTLAIGYLDIHAKTTQVLALQDYEAEVWSPKCRIALPKEEIQIVCGNVFCENGDVVVHVIHRCWRSYSLYHYDSKGELLDKVSWQHVNPTVLGFYFRESLVSHVFFQRKRKENGRSRVRVPSFFRGL